MIHVVLGTKAQLVKMAPILGLLARRGLSSNFVFTGQHRETIDAMLDEFGLARPDVVLYDGDDVVSIPHMAAWMARILWRAATDRERVFRGDRDGIVLVHGDTFSTLLGAMMGRLAGLRVGHVESGLRSFDPFHPFPEELTRLATFRLSHVLFCPGAWAMQNVARLRRERIDTGANTLGDTLDLALGLAHRTDHVPPGRFGIVSLHRYENVFRRERLGRLVETVECIAEHVPLLFILHPPTRARLERHGYYARLAGHPRVELRPRYTYVDFVALLTRAEFVVTDGGSVQEESAYLGLPCLLLRGATERREGLGENAVLSEYKPEVVDEFVRRYASYRRAPRRAERSPSEIVVDAVARYG